MSSLLEIDHLAVSLPIDGAMAPVIHDATLSIRSGEAVGLIGESGSGKTMTARAVMRLLPGGAEARGGIRFDGQDVLAMDGRALKDYRTGGVAMIFQDPRAHINPVRRIGDFLTEAMRYNRGMSRKAAEQKAIALLAEVGIEDGERRLGQYPHQLSGGLLQRVMIASALISEPALLLADEPTTALDVTTQAEVVKIVDRLRRDRDLALLFITHDLELASDICDRICVMYAGSVVEDQQAKDVHTRPLHPYTAALLRSRPEVTRRLHRLPVVPGQPRSAFEVGDGCAFADRCTHVDDRCRAGSLDLVEVRDGGLSRCRKSAQWSETGGPQVDPEVDPDGAGGPRE